MKKYLVSTLAFALVTASVASIAQSAPMDQSSPGMQGSMMGMKQDGKSGVISTQTPAKDEVFINSPEPGSRQLLQMPEAAKNTLRIEMLERLQALQQVMQAISAGRPQDGAQAAKSGIGTGVMMRHSKRSPDATPRNFMPEGMLPLSKQSHMLGDELSDALKAGNRMGIDAKLAEVTGNCVACHNLYRIN
jgi:hypothetical protein